MQSTILSSLSMNRCPPKRGHVHPATTMPVCARRRTRPTDVATGQSTPRSDTATRPAGGFPTTLIITSVTFDCQLPPAIDRACAERIKNCLANSRPCNRPRGVVHLSTLEQCAAARLFLDNLSRSRSCLAGVLVRRVVFPDNVLITSHGVQARRLNRQKK